MAGSRAFDTSFFGNPDRGPDADSAGIGRWGLMGRAAHGSGRGERTEVHGEGNFILRAAAASLVSNIPRVEPDTTLFAAAVPGE